MAATTAPTISHLTEGIYSDIEKLIGQHLTLLKEEVKGEIGKVATAGASVGSGAALALLGTVLGGMAAVHLTREVTKLPLWLCYAGGSALACSAAAGLFVVGAREAAEIDLLPEGTGQFLADAVTSDRR